MRGVLRGNGTDLHAEATTIFRDVTDLGFGADLALLDKEMQTHDLAFFLARASLQEKPRGAQIADPRDVAIGLGLPIDPYVIDRGNSRRSSAGGAGYCLNRTHRDHP